MIAALLVSGFASFNAMAQQEARVAELLSSSRVNQQDVAKVVTSAKAAAWANSPAFDATIVDAAKADTKASVGTDASPVVVQHFNRALESRLYLLSLSKSADPRVLNAAVPGTTRETLRQAAFSRELAPGLVSSLRNSYPRTPLAPLVERKADTFIYRPGLGNNGTPPSLGLKPSTPPRFFPAEPGGRRLAVPFYRQGFPEIALLTWDGEEHCTATLVDGEWLITAAHCVASIDDQSQKPLLRPQLLAKLAVVFPSDVGSDCVYAPQQRHTNAKDRCHFKYLRPVEIPRFALDWSGEAVSDVALIRISATDTAQRKHAVVGSPNGTIGEITLAGYGFRSVGITEPPETLEVGWQKLDISPGSRATLIVDNPSASSPCGGDSGGPVFAGTNVGADDEQHVLIGVISNGVPSDPSASCSSSRAFYPLVASPATRRWLCSNPVAAKFAACGQPVASQGGHNRQQSLFRRGLPTVDPRDARA